MNQLFLGNEDASIWLENVGDTIDVPTLLSSASIGTNVRITGLEIEVDSVGDIEDFYDVLDTMHGLNASGGTVQTAQVYGTISIDKISYSDKQTLSARYSGIAIDNEHYQAFKYFYSEDGTTLIGSMEYLDGTTEDTVPGYPSKSSTE
mgnify:CR=1 FL=1